MELEFPTHQGIFMDGDRWKGLIDNGEALYTFCLLKQFQNIWEDCERAIKVLPEFHYYGSTQTGGPATSSPVDTTRLSDLTIVFIYHVSTLGQLVRLNVVH